MLKEQNRERVRQCRERAKKAKNNVKAVQNNDDTVSALKTNIPVKEELSQNQFRKQYPNKSRSQIREMYQEYLRTVFPQEQEEMKDVASKTWH